MTIISVYLMEFCDCNPLSILLFFSSSGTLLESFVNFPILMYLVCELSCIVEALPMK